MNTKAFYNDKPETLEAVGNGSYLYRFNIVQESVDQLDAQAEGEAQAKPQWSCDEVTIWSPLSANKITEAVIGSLCPLSHEQKLVNEYNSAQMGLLGGSKTSDEAKKATAKYKEFLENRAMLKAIVDADCVSLGIR